MKAKGFDKKFDNGEDVIKYLDLKKATRPNTLGDRKGRPNILKKLSKNRQKAWTYNYWRKLKKLFQNLSK